MAGWRVRGSPDGSMRRSLSGVREHSSRFLTGDAEWGLTRWSWLGRGSRAAAEWLHALLPNREADSLKAALPTKRQAEPARPTQLEC